MLEKPKARHLEMMLVFWWKGRKKACWTVLWWWESGMETLTDQPTEIQRKDGLWGAL